MRVYLTIVIGLSRKYLALGIIATSLFSLLASRPLPSVAQSPSSSVISAPTGNEATSEVNFPPNETDYTLGSGDRLRLDVFQAKDYSGEYTVLVDGSLSLPLVGKIEVEGMTLSQVTELLTQRYALYIKRPVVTVSLIAPRPLKIAISGEVNRPGSYNLPLNDVQKFPTLTDMIQKAGGITTTADVREVKIRRSLRGVERLLTVNLWDLLQAGNLKQDITLRDGDTIFIPTKEEIDPAEIRQLADANFGIQTDRTVAVAVVGEVYRPGSYKVSPQEANASEENGNSQSQPPRLTQAIVLAGGIKPLANIREVEVRRFTRDGKQQTMAVDLWQLLETGEIDKDIILQEGDTIVIPKAPELAASEAETLASANFAPSTIRVNVVGEVKEPGVVEVPPNTPLAQAILAAGGFDDKRAATDSVELIRLNPNGTVSKRKIEVDFAAGINEESNPSLRNNDAIVVRRSGLTEVTDTIGTVLNPLGVFNIFRIFD